MQLYTDEMPQSCISCPYHYHECNAVYYCGLINDTFTMNCEDYFKRQDFCPLQSLETHDKIIKQKLYQKTFSNIKKKYILIKKNKK